MSPNPLPIQLAAMLAAPSYDKVPEKINRSKMPAE
jgi:hypothetical protein